MTLKGTRRDFIKRAGLAATFVTFLEAGQEAANQPGPSEKRIRVGVQLYSVRQQAEKDLPAVLRLIKAMGYEGVEFAGYYGWSARQLAAMLQDVGLSCCGTHTALQTLLGDELEKTLEFNRTIGNPYLIVPSLPRSYTANAEAWKRAADLFSELAAKVKPLGFWVGYHCHAGDFEPVDGSCGWDIFFGRTNQDVIMQLDTGNAAAAGVDSLSVLRRYPGRTRTVHLKPFSRVNPGAAIGEDELPWSEILEWCETQGGTDWYIVEYEADRYAGLDGIYQCLLGLCRLGRCGGRRQGS